MKKPLKFILLITFLGILFFLSYQIILKINHKNEIAQNLITVPTFSCQNVKGGFFTNENLKKRTNTIFIYFNTDCEYCNEEAQMVRDNINEFHKAQLIFVSIEKPEIIKKFAQKHQLTTYDNVYFLCDNKATFANTFDVNSIPYMVLYDKDNNLIEKIKGQTKAEILLQKLNLD